MIHLVRDITERKKVDENLSREQYLMNSLMDHLPLHIYFKDKESKFIRINDAHAKSFGLNKPNEAIGKSDFDFFSEEHARQAFEDEQEIIRSGKPLIKEEKETRADLPDTWVSTIKLPLVDHEGNIVGTFGISRDITESKQAQEELIKALAKAEESDRLKTAFLNNISHEIRTPFNGILGFLSIIQTGDLNEDERDEYIEIINQSADRLMQTINDMVEMAQIQTRQIKLEITETDIKRLTDKLTVRYQNAAERQKLEFNIINDLPENISSINIDGKKLKTILSNLIVNAIKFTKEGSIILRIRLNGDQMEFSVTDTGIGISEKQQQVIFELFNQADVSNTRQFEGLGLGLSITKSYVEMLGGKIWIESEPDKGSTFYFTIPYAP
jgi:PAS domain S-box-containing protein